MCITIGVGKFTRLIVNKLSIKIGSLNIDKGRITQLDIASTGNDDENDHLLFFSPETVNIFVRLKKGWKT